jgi:hypothetical protein
MSSEPEPEPQSEAQQMELSTRQDAIRVALLRQGVDSEVTEAIVQSKWAKSTSSNLSAAWAQWAQFAAQDAQIDVLSPTPVDVVNFLKSVRRGEMRKGEKAGVQTTAAWVRGVRSAISTTCNLWQNHPERLGEHPLVSYYVQALINEDMHAGVRVYRYDDTWDTEPVFDMLRQSQVVVFAWDTASTGFVAKVKRLRDETVAEGRILLTCRSHDLTCVHRGVRSVRDCLVFHFAVGEPMAGIWSVKQQQAQPVGPRPEAPQCDAGEYGITGVSVRFYMPKQRHHMEARSHGYTDWITVPATPDEPATCFAVRLFAYVMATELMLQEDDGLFVTFQTSKLHSGKCWGLSADALANVMGRMMAEAGIPPEFRPHSARHAGQALLKSKGTADADVMARANMSQRTYVTHYMRQIRRVQVFDVAP